MPGEWARALARCKRFAHNVCMKDAVLTIRLAAATRRSLEAYAKHEARSLSQAAELLLQLGLQAARSGEARTSESKAGWKEPEARWNTLPPPLAGSLAGGLVPTLEDFRAVRAEISGSLDRRTRTLAKPPRR